MPITKNNVPKGSLLDNIINQLENSNYKKAYGNLFEEEIFNFGINTGEISLYITDFSDSNNIGIPSWVGKENIVNFDEEQNTDNIPPANEQQAPEQTIPENMENRQVDIDTSKSQWYLEIPKAITAIQFVGNNFENMSDFCNNGRYRIEDLGDGTLKLTDSDGSTIVNPGDYVASLKSGFSVYKAEEFVKNYQYIEKDSDAETVNPSMNEENNEQIDDQNMDDIPDIPPDVQNQFSNALSSITKKVDSLKEKASGTKKNINKIVGNIKNTKTFNKAKEKADGEVKRFLNSPSERMNDYKNVLGVAAELKDTFNKLRKKPQYQQPEYEEQDFSAPTLSGTINKAKNVIKNVKNQGLKAFKDLDKQEGVNKITSFGDVNSVTFNFGVGSVLDNKIVNSVNKLAKVGKHYGVDKKQIKNFKNDHVKNISEDNLKKGANTVGQGVGNLIGGVINKFRNFSNLDDIVLHTIKKYEISPITLSCTIKTLDTMKGLNHADDVNEQLSKGMVDLFINKLKINDLINENEIINEKINDNISQTKITFDKNV